MTEATYQAERDRILAEFTFDKSPAELQALEAEGLALEIAYRGGHA